MPNAGFQFGCKVADVARSVHWPMMDFLAPRARPRIGAEGVLSFCFWIRRGPHAELFAGG